MNYVWLPLVIEEAIGAAHRLHALEVWEKGPHLLKSKNGLTCFDVATVVLCGGKTSDTIKSGMMTKSVESVFSVELSHRARPLSIGVLLACIQELYERRSSRGTVW